MSIIFDALKRAEAQAQKGRAPTFANARIVSHARSKTRLWVLACLFVVVGLSAWWFRGSSAKPSGIILTTDADKPSPTARETGVTAGELTNNSGPQADFSLKKVPAVVENPVAATDLSTAESKASGTRQLSVPSLDLSLTGAAQFDKRPEPVAVMPPISAVKQVEPPLAKPAQAKPAQAIPPAPIVAPEPIAIPAPVAAVAPPPVAPPVVAPPEPALPSVFELDYKIRLELPKMPVSMYVYNAQPQFRFVIIGGKRYAEGEQIENKVNITKIRADGLECDYQGTRFFYPRQSL